MYFEFVKAVDWLARFVLRFFFFALLFAINNVLSISFVVTLYIIKLLITTVNTY